MPDTKQVPVRFPADVKAWLMDQAARNRSSQNSEVIRAVRERMDRVDQPLPDLLKKTIGYLD